MSLNKSINLSKSKPSLSLIPLTLPLHSTGAQDPISALFAEKLSQYKSLAAQEGDMVGVTPEQVAKQQAYLERLKKMYVVEGDIGSFPEKSF